MKAVYLFQNQRLKTVTGAVVNSHVKNWFIVQGKEMFLKLLPEKNTYIENGALLGVIHKKMAPTARSCWIVYRCH